MTKERQKQALLVLVAVMAAVWAYRLLTPETTRTQPLAYTRGMKVSAPVRGTAAASGSDRDPLTRFLARRIDKYPGVQRDLFRAQAQIGERRTKPALLTKPAATARTAPTPTVKEKTAEEIAEDKARTDLLSFRFLGYLTDKDSSLFLSKDGELFIAKNGDRLLESYRIKEVGKDFVVLQDTVTKVEVRVELTGSGEGKDAPAPGRVPGRR